ncbi:UNVERIFIED_CONTAM: hypothetical protein RMT77_000120 [Armadillidium vulgare]
MEKRVFIMFGGVLSVLAFILLVTLTIRYSSPRSEEIELPDSLDSSSCPKDFDPLPLIVFSLDGFHPKYLTKNVTPTLNKMIEKGVTTPFMTPSFPSLTFPNHYTIVTGLYPDSHGIVANNFYDKVFGAKFTYSTKETKEGRWWGGEPIWNTLRKNGLLSATYYWPGSESPINGHQPNYWYEYKRKIPLSQRIEQVLEWLSLPKEKRPSYISVYSHQPDKAGHGYGPDSEQVLLELKKVDSMVKQLVKALIKKDLLSCVNIIVVSDHGMSATGEDKVIHLEKLISKDLVNQILVGPGAFGSISLKNQSRSNASQELEDSLACRREEMLLFRKEDLPKRLHYSNNRRITDYVILLKEEYTINFLSNFNLKGVHGYDSHSSSMNGLFIAYGPAFKENFQLKPFQNVELYNFFCHLLGVEPAPNNGTEGLLYPALKSPPPYKEPVKVHNFTIRKLPNLTELQNIQIEPTCANISDTVYELLKRTEENSEKLLTESTPWGAPVPKNSSTDVQVLLHLDFVSGYSSYLKQTVWTSFVIKTLPSSPSEEKWQWVADPRLVEEDSQSCSSVIYDEQGHNYTLYPNFPPGNAQNESTKVLSTLVSNSVPLHPHLYSHWKELINTFIPKWFKESQSPLNVIVGPVFDENNDGLADEVIPIEGKRSIPTDYFFIVSKCSSGVKSLDQCPEDQIHSLSYIYPQNLAIKICSKNATDYALLFGAKVQDIERITNLEFFSKLSHKRRLEILTNEYYHLW